MHNTDVTPHVSFIALILEQSKDEILQVVRAKLDAKSAQDGTLNSLSQFFSELVHVLVDPQKGTGGAAELGTAYGKLQASLNRSIDESMAHFYLLQEATFERLRDIEGFSDTHRCLIRHLFADGVLHMARSLGESLQKQAKEERELREQFVLAVAHDLRSPLTGIRTYAELVSRFPQQAERNKTLAGRITAGVDRMDRMVSNFYDAHRIRAGMPIDLDLRETDFASILRDVIDNLSASHGDRFVTRLTGNWVGHWCPDALERVIENLLTNALKYGHQTAPIVITAGTAEGEKDVLEFSISNEGDPIPLAEQATMFQLFSRATNARRSGKPGWGIGLALVRGLIEAHGGTVRLESACGHGTTFYIRLPREARTLESEDL